MVTVHDVADYIVLKLKEAGAPLSALKLQKLLYYVQAWHLAFHGVPLFRGKFQAWVHGPVNRDLYDRFSGTKSLYSDIRLDDVREHFNPNDISADDRMHIDTVLEHYAKYSGSQLEDLTHRELPWIEAREGYAPAERCEREISEDTMQSYYAGRLG